MIVQNPNTISSNDIFNPKKNSFSFIRFFLSILVIFSHSYALGGFGSEGLFGSNQETYGGFAVYSFFILSGFLITRSYTTSLSIINFLWNRFLRIFPGFWVCLVITVLVFAPIVYLAEYGDIRNYIYSEQNSPLDYLKNNFFLEMKQYGISNCLKNIPHSTAFNGSLWTLIYEAKCYLLIGLLGWLDILKTNRKIVLYMYLLLLLIYIINIGIPGSAIKVCPYFSDIYILNLTMYFLSGAVYFLFLKNNIFNTKTVLFMIGLTAISIKHQFYPLIAPLTLPYLLFYLGFKPWFANFDKYGDFSYGMYIYAFPIQQMLSFFKVNTKGFILYFCLSLLITTILSIASYVLIEKPFLKLKKIQIRFG
jgi:peptidoglycan/LPS O-acetylase OafA/YrhL